MADGLARQIAGLMGDIRNLGKRIPSYQRGVVANVSPPTVIMDRDVTATPRPVADVLVPGLAVGQRVEVRVIGSRRVITSIHPADNESYVPFAMATGTVTVSLSDANNASGEFSYPAGRFTVEPMLFASVNSVTGQYNIAGAYSLSTVRGIVYVRRTAGNTVTYNAPVNWMAIQMTPTSAAG